MMQKSWLVVWACLGAAACGQAQENAGKEMSYAGWLLPETPAMHGPARAKQSFAASGVSAARNAALPAALLAGPEPAPLPRRGITYNQLNEARWELGFGLSDMVFNGPDPLQGNLIGVNSSLSYFINGWLAVEGVATSVYSSKVIPVNAHIKAGVYGGGIRMVNRKKMWQPWGHFAMGLAHEQPQTLYGGENALAYVAGGGADYRLSPLLSFRIQADLVGTAFFGQTQRHYQITTGVVLNF